MNLNGGAEGDRTLDLRIAKAGVPRGTNDLAPFRGAQRAEKGLGGVQLWHTAGGRRG